MRRFVISILLELVYSNVLIWLAGKALQPFIANTTLWGNAAKLVAIVGGTVLSYSLMRFWTFAGLSKKLGQLFIKETRYLNFVRGKMES